MSLLLHMFLTAASTLNFEAQCKSFFRWSACISQIHTLELKIDFYLHSPLCLFFFTWYQEELLHKFPQQLDILHQLFNAVQLRRSAGNTRGTSVCVSLWKVQTVCVFQCVVRNNTYICVAMLCNNLVVIVQDLIKVTTEELASVECAAEIRGRRLSIPADFRWL